MALESSLESYCMLVISSMHEEFGKRDWEAKRAGEYGEWASCKRKHHEVSSSQLLLIESCNLFF
jgi:hypothetical protein